MKTSVIALSTAAAAFVAMPVVANAATVGRSAAPVVGQQGLGNEDENGGGLLIALLAAAAVIAGIILIADGGDDNGSDLPTSP